ncbi:MAG TPA: ABC transporter ATP-binding protein [Steroidobacteraceae bacterium]|nr:ABC transporter ATP-binding protein [Steroidobacteraceae bacterium]
MSELRAQRLRITVPGRVLVDDLDCVIHGGEFIAVLGSNGTGKSLLLRTLAGLRPASGGSVLLDGAPLTALPRRAIAQRMGFLPQDPDAPPQGSLFESVLLGRHAHLGFWESQSAEDAQRATRALASVGLDTLGPRELATLSGGEQRRAAIARLLVQAPAIYLLDEPTNHLDPAQQLGILEHMRTLSRAGAAVIVSLHEPNLALRFADRAWLLAGDGPMDIVDCQALGPRHLARLYGVEYAEARIGELRLMTPARTVGSR